MPWRRLTIGAIDCACRLIAAVADFSCQRPPQSRQVHAPKVWAGSWPLGQWRSPLAAGIDQPFRGNRSHSFRLSVGGMSLSSTDRSQTVFSKKLTLVKFSAAQSRVDPIRTRMRSRPPPCGSSPARASLWRLVSSLGTGVLSRVRYVVGACSWRR